MIKLEEQPIVTTESYLFNTWIKGTEIVKTEKGDITVLEILNDFRSHLLQNLDHNKEAYHQKQCAIHDVSVSFEEGYKKGWREATNEACKEIAKNYTPNER